MPVSAPRFQPLLIAALERLDDRGRPIAETNRQLGSVAELLGFPRPSYEQVRQHVHELRRRDLDRQLGSVLLDVAFRVRPPDAFLDALAG